MAFASMLLTQFIVFQCILKGQAEGDAEGKKTQARSSQREQGDPEVEEDHANTERGQTDQERESEAAAATDSSTGFDLGNRDTGPRQVKFKSYPQDSFGVQKRAFNNSWYEKHNWLEYSVNQNAAFCFPCRVSNMIVWSVVVARTGRKL